MKEYPCILSKTMSRHGGNKHYNYGYWGGTAEYCRKVKKWVRFREMS